MPLSIIGIVFFCFMLVGFSPSGQAQVLRNLVNVEGIRENQLIGYGVVVGLNGTGDNTQVKFAGQSVANLLKQFGIKQAERQTSNMRVKNVAAVMVNATLPPGYRKGQSIDVTVSSLGDAKSLRGGTLLLTPLRAVDGEVYALAQGSLVVAGISAQGRSGSNVTINTPTAGRIPNGASIEREIPTDFDDGNIVRLSLKRPNFQTATNIVNSLNARFGRIASARDATSIEVRAPVDPTERVAFVARLERMNVNVGQDPPRVVFNSRNGTVVIAQGVTVRPVAVSHGSLRVVISEQSLVSQPQAFAGGRTAIVPDSQVSVEQGNAQMFQIPGTARLQTIIDTINRVGATPDDIMSILQALDQAGALDGELIVI